MLCFHFNYIHTHIYILGRHDNTKSLNSQSLTASDHCCSQFILSHFPDKSTLQLSRTIIPSFLKPGTYFLSLLLTDDTPCFTEKTTEEDFHSPPPPPYQLHCSTGDLSTFRNLTSTWMPGHHPFPPTWAHQSYIEPSFHFFYSTGLFPYK